MTSNLGSNLISDPDINDNELENRINELLFTSFRPEFINRIDKTIIFKRLTQDQIQKIVDIQLNRLRRRLEDKKIDIEVTDDAKKYLSTTGYDTTFGARPLKRLIQSTIEDELALKIIEEKIKPGDSIVIDYDGRKMDIKPKLIH